MKKVEEKRGLIDIGTYYHDVFQIQQWIKKIKKAYQSLQNRTTRWYSRVFWLPLSINRSSAKFDRFQKSEFEIYPSRPINVLKPKTESSASVVVISKLHLSIHSSLSIHLKQSTSEWSQRKARRANTALRYDDYIWIPSDSEISHECNVWKDHELPSCRRLPSTCWSLWWYSKIRRIGLGWVRWEWWKCELRRVVNNLEWLTYRRCTPAPTSVLFIKNMLKLTPKADPCRWTPRIFSLIGHNPITVSR